MPTTLRVLKIRAVSVFFHIEVLPGVVAGGGLLVDQCQHLFIEIRDHFVELLPGRSMFSSLEKYLTCFRSPLLNWSQLVKSENNYLLLLLFVLAEVIQRSTSKKKKARALRPL